MLPIYAGSLRVGEIRTGPEGLSIAYQPEWRAAAGAFPVSLSMPLSRPEWGAGIATPWLMNLLPEGEPLRAMTRALGVAAEDILGLIAASGRDLAGALSISALTEDPGFVPITTDSQLERIINELPAKPFLAGDDGVAMSLAGAQDKLPVVLSDGVFAIPVNGAASTHILKPDNSRLPGSVQNEALCMVLARRCGLDVADVTTGNAGGRSYLLVTRYDRIVSPAQVTRVHQEDFCQALGRPPAAKYERSGAATPGPSLADMFALVREYMTAKDITRLLDAVIFNIATGNVDSHAKNYSILLHPDRCELAPLYDLMSGLAWPNITRNHAQAIGGQRQGRYIFARHWRRMADAAGLAGPAAVRRVAALAGRILSELPAAVEEVATMPAGRGMLLETLAREIEARARTVRTNAALEDGASAEDDTPDSDIRYET